MGVTANETAQVQEGSALGFRRHKLALDVMSSLPLAPGTSLPSWLRDQLPEDLS